MNCPKCNKKMIFSSAGVRDITYVATLGELHPTVITSSITKTYICENCFDVSVTEKVFEKYYPKEDIEYNKKILEKKIKIDTEVERIRKETDENES